ncbi:MAG: MFS transporter [Clostridia bacterium]|nr:MFS transporter [Clostridia bacterium]
MSSKIEKPNKNPLWQTTKSERQSYYLYFFGQNMIYSLLAGFLTTYLVFKEIDPVMSGIVVTIVKVWDAVNDAIFGVIFDKIKFKSGKKYIPWLKIACALTPAATVAVFAIPSAAPEMVKLIWFALAYIVWDTAYTICDVPAFGIITAMTDQIEERNTIISLKGITGGIGSALTTVLVTLFIGQTINIGYGPTAVIIAIVAAATMFPICRKCKERNKPEVEEEFTVRSMIKYVVSNKYLLVYYLGYIFYSGAQTYTALHLLTAYYIFGNELISLITGTVAAAPQLIMALLVPKIIRKIDKFSLFKICVIATIALSIPLCFTQNSLILFIIMFMLRSIPLGVVGVLSFTFTPDCAEYGQFTTGTEAKGITFAIQTFAVKLAAAISSGLGLVLLGLFKFKTQFMGTEIENIDQLVEQGLVKLQENGAVKIETFANYEAIGAAAMQSKEAINGLWFTYNVVPIIGLVIALAIWNLYKLQDKQVQIMADCNAGKLTKKKAKDMLKDLRKIEKAEKLAKIKAKNKPSKKK